MVPACNEPSGEDRSAPRGDGDALPVLHIESIAEPDHVVLSVPVGPWNWTVNGGQLAGAGAIVMPSLFEEEIENEEIELAASLDQGTEGFAEALDYFPEVDTFVGEGDRYLRSLEALKRQSNLPIIASLNANSVGGWVRFAKLMADAGADALELNLYRISVDRTMNAVEVEDEDLDLDDQSDVKRTVYGMPARQTDLESGIGPIFYRNA